MRKILVLLLLLLTNAFALEAMQNVGISKYAVLEVLNDRTPLRDNYNEYASRLSHLAKDTVLFADKQTENYYRIELEPKKYGWVNKKDIEVQGIIPEKRFKGIEKLLFKTQKDKYLLKIITPQKSAYELSEIGDNLSLNLYDNRFDPLEVKVSNLSGRFRLSNKFENTFRLNFNNDKKLFGYSFDAIEDGYLLTIKRPPKINKKKPLKGIRVVVDPGHGGSEFGASAFGLKEKDINLQISKILRRELRRRGAKVYITRKRDKKLSLYDRVDFAREKQADILLSIHQNALPDPKDINKKHGVGTYYYNKQSYALAEAIQKRLLPATGFMDDKVNYRSFALTRPTDQLSVLVECGYLIYKPEADKLADKKFQKLIAKAIVKGCEDCLRENY